MSENPFESALKEKAFETYCLLLGSGLEAIHDPILNSSEKPSALEELIRGCREEGPKVDGYTKKMLTYGANPTAKTRGHFTFYVDSKQIKTEGLSAASAALLNKRETISKVLFSAMSLADRTSVIKEGAFILALSGDNIEVATLLLKSGANPNEKIIIGGESVHPLEVVCSGKMISLLKKNGIAIKDILSDESLVSRIMSRQMVKENKALALGLASLFSSEHEEPSFSLFEKLLESQTNNRQLSALIEKGIIPHEEDCPLGTVLNIAVNKQNLLISKKLTERGVSPHVRDKEGRTPVMEVLFTLNRAWDKWGGDPHQMKIKELLNIWMKTPPLPEIGPFGVKGSELLFITKENANLLKWDEASFIKQLKDFLTTSEKIDCFSKGILRTLFSSKNKMKKQMSTMDFFDALEIKIAEIKAMDLGFLNTDYRSSDAHDSFLEWAGTSEIPSFIRREKDPTQSVLFPFMLALLRQEKNQSTALAAFCEKEKSLIPVFERELLLSHSSEVSCPREGAKKRARI